MKRNNYLEKKERKFHPGNNTMVNQVSLMDRFKDKQTKKQGDPTCVGDFLDTNDFLGFIVPHHV